MSNEFLNFVNKLMEANPELTKSLMTKNIESYLMLIADEKPAGLVLTEKGAELLAYIQANLNDKPFKSADVALGLGISSRGIAASMRKLVNDGFCSAIGKNPIIYNLTEKGRNYIIENKEN